MAGCTLLLPSGSLSPLIHRPASSSSSGGSGLAPLVFPSGPASLHPLPHLSVPCPAPLQPTVVAVCCGAYLEQWHLYKAGIMDASMQCTRPLDHSVLVVGYDTDAATGQA